jgi:hypothetical protein
MNIAAIKLPHGALFSVYQNCNYHRIYVQKTGNENIQAKKQTKAKKDTSFLRNLGARRVA